MPVGTFLSPTSLLRAGPSNHRAPCEPFPYCARPSLSRRRWPEAGLSRVSTPQARWPDVWGRSRLAAWAVTDRSPDHGCVIDGAGVQYPRLAEEGGGLRSPRTGAATAAGPDPLEGLSEVNSPLPAGTTGGSWALPGEFSGRGRSTLAAGPVPSGPRFTHRQRRGNRRGLFVRRTLPGGLQTGGRWAVPPSQDKYTAPCYDCNIRVGSRSSIHAGRRTFSGFWTPFIGHADWRSSTPLRSRIQGRSWARTRQIEGATTRTRPRSAEPPRT